jgi:hypothetical protein
MGRIGKNLLYAISFTLASFLPGCEPDEPIVKDTIAPKINIISPLEQKVYDSNTVPFQWSIEEANFKSAWYSTDNEQTKSSIEKANTKNLDLSNGTHNIIVYADDNSNNFSRKNVSFSVNKITDNTPPKINIISPLEQKVYDSNTVPFQWAIEEANFKSAWYSLDNGSKVPIAKSGIENKNFENGNHKIVVGANDLYTNASKDSVLFSVNKITDNTPPKITISSPIKNKVYDLNEISLSWEIEEENFKSAWYSLDNGSKVSIAKSGTENKYLENGNHKIVLCSDDLYTNSSKDSVLFSVDKQNWLYIINPFISTNQNGKAYDLLKTKTERENYVQEKLYEDWVNTIPGNINFWDCTEYSEQLMTNFHGFPNETGYSGSNLDSIYYYHRTYKDNGKYGIPVYFVLISTGIGHNMNAILTGDDATKFENWSFIEPQKDKIIKPGEEYMPETCTLDIRAPPKDRNGRQYENVPILMFEVKNKIPSLVWINYDDPNLNIIMKR